MNAWGDIPPRDLYLYGPMPDDSRHNIRATLVYRITPWLSTGALYSYNSGMPYSRYFRNDTTGGFDDLRARVGTNPGANINDPGDDRETRLAGPPEAGAAATRQPQAGHGPGASCTRTS